jgi:gliding motility-associated protein GldM
MAGGKETPRQKMIGMMYLFLTAMLALNVSKSVLDSFVMVNDSLTNTVENFTEKNNSIYADFEKQASMNEEKVGVWRDLANEVKRQSNELVEFINSLKIEVVKASDGEDAPAIVDGDVVAKLIAAKDNLNVGAQIMVGPNNDGKGVDLRKKIDSFREYLLSKTNEEHKITRKGIEKNLNTSPPPPKDGIQVSWSHHHFANMPLAAVITMMTKMQSDIRNAEADILRYFYSQISAQDYKFNKLDPVVIPSGSYVLQGEKYEADVFIAAQDTTQQPSVYIGDYRKSEHGRYEMVGSYDSLEIINGRGYYVGSTSGIGDREWGGLISIKAPDGSIQRYPFKQSYTVARPTAIISPSANRVFYYGVDNPLEVSVPGLRADEIRPRATNARIVKKGKGYAVRPERKGGTIKVSLYGTVNGNQKLMGSSDFSVKEIPNPTPLLLPTKAKSGDITKAEISIAKGLDAVLEGFIMENISYQVVSYTLSTMDGRFAVDERVQGATFTPKVRDMIAKASRGQQLTFVDIKAKGPDGIKDLSPLVFKIK